MKVDIVFKTPDVVDSVLKENDIIDEEQQEDTKEKLRKWIKYDEYVTIQIDLEAGTAIVLPVGD